MFLLHPAIGCFPSSFRAKTARRRAAIMKGRDERDDGGSRPPQLDVLQSVGLITNILQNK